jgi:hypothetical protein
MGIAASGYEAGTPMEAVFTTTKDRLFNASAYTPGDYKLFLSDPRTLAEYEKWAPFLLGSEDFAAGKRHAGASFRQKTIKKGKKDKYDDSADVYEDGLE